VEAGIPGMHPTGIQVNRGDTITILAKGNIDLTWGRGAATLYGPKGMLVFQLRENDRLGEYIEPELIEIKENGAIYMGTRFIVTQESDFAQGYKEAIVKATERDTIVTAGTFGPIRVLKNQYSLNLQNIIEKPSSLFLSYAGQTAVEILSSSSNQR
jgi:hypothetical protein